MNGSTTIDAMAVLGELAQCLQIGDPDEVAAHARSTLSRVIADLAPRLYLRREESAAVATEPDKLSDDRISVPLVHGPSTFGALECDRPESEELISAVTTGASLIAAAIAHSTARTEERARAELLQKRLGHQKAELQRRVKDLEDTRTAMLQMMSEALETHRELRNLTAGLEGLVTERTREAIAAKELAERANELKSQFLSRVSHELRTPIHGVLGFARLGVRKIEKSTHAKNRYYFEQILESSQELLGLITDLLDFSHIESGDSSYIFAAHDLPALIDDIAQKYEPLMDERDLVLRQQMDLDCPQAVFDPRHMRQIVTNLLGNAMKFAPAGSEVMLTTRREGSFCVIEVADRGPGIPEDELATIFEKFVQSSRTRHVGDGTGLGLPIARGIARNHGGDLTAENRPGGGAVFRLRFPLGGQAG